MASTAYASFRSTAVTNTAVSVKAEPTMLIGYNIINQDLNDAIYIKLYDRLVANVTVGTTTPEDTIHVPAGQSVVIRDGHKGVLFSTALVIAAVKESADSGTTAPDILPIIKLYYE